MTELTNTMAVLQSFAQKIAIQKFIADCASGNLDEVRKFLSASHFSSKYMWLKKLLSRMLRIELLTPENFTEEKFNDGFCRACSEGQDKVVNYLLTSNELKIHANINHNNDEGLILACRAGHLETVQYLLTSSKLKHHACIHAQNDDALMHACFKGHLDIVKYLLTSGDLSEHARADVNKSLGLPLAFQQGHMEVVTYLLYEMMIDVPDNEMQDPEQLPGLRHCVEKRDLFFKMNGALTGNTSQDNAMATQRPKI